MNFNAKQSKMRLSFSMWRSSPLSTKLLFKFSYVSSKRLATSLVESRGATFENYAFEKSQNLELAKSCVHFLIASVKCIWDILFLLINVFVICGKMNI